MTVVVEVYTPEITIAVTEVANEVIVNQANIVVEVIDIGAVIAKGIPIGGSGGQVLAKASADNYDTEWESLATVATTGSYNDLTNKPTIPAEYTNEQAQDAVGGILTDTATIDFTYNDGTPSIAADVKDGSLGVSKLSATGTPSATTFLCGDNTWAIPSGGGTTLPAFTAQRVLFGDGTDIPVTDSVFLFDSATKRLSIGSTIGGLSVANNTPSSTPIVNITATDTAAFGADFYQSIGSSVSMILQPSAFSSGTGEIYTAVTGSTTSIEYSPTDTGTDDLYFVQASVIGGTTNISALGSYTSNITLDEADSTLKGYSYTINNAAKLASGTSGTMFKNSSGFTLNVTADADENSDPATTINNYINGFSVFTQAFAGTNGTTSIVGVNYSGGFSGTSKAGDSFYGIKLATGSMPMPNATNYYSFYSEGGEAYFRSNLATRKNMTLQAAASQTANFLDLQNSAGTSIAGIRSNGAYELPQLTTTQINAIASPKNGTLVYNTTLHHFCGYQNGAWVKFSHTPM